MNINPLWQNEIQSSKIHFNYNAQSIRPLCNATDGLHIKLTTTHGWMNLPKGTFNKQNIAELKTSKIGNLQFSCSLSKIHSLSFLCLGVMLMGELQNKFFSLSYLGFSMDVRFGWQTYKPEHAATCVIPAEQRKQRKIISHHKTLIIAFLFC